MIKEINDYSPSSNHNIKKRIMVNSERETIIYNIKEKLLIFNGIFIKHMNRINPEKVEKSQFYCL